MSMICMYRTLSSEEAQRASSDDAFLDTLIAKSIEEGFEAQKRQFQEHKSRSRETHATEALKSAAVATESILNIDRLWHGLHWLLCQDPIGGPKPLSDAVFGGSETGRDRGYGPARLVDLGTVSRVAEALADLDHKELRRRFN